MLYPGIPIPPAQKLAGDCNGCAVDQPSDAIPSEPKDNCSNCATTTPPSQQLAGDCTSCVTPRPAPQRAHPRPIIVADAACRAAGPSSSGSAPTPHLPATSACLSSALFSAQADSEHIRIKVGDPARPVVINTQCHPTVRIKVTNPGCESLEVSTHSDAQSRA
jgi:hypothetical protein